MWLKEKVVSTFSFFLSDAKFYVPELQLLYAKRIQQMYEVQPGYFLILNSCAKKGGFLLNAHQY